MGSDTALLVVDVQVGFIEGDPPVYQAADMVARIKGLIGKARAAHAPVIYVQHNTDPDIDGPVHPDIAPAEGDVVVLKYTPDSFHETALKQMERGFGGVLACDIGETIDDAKRFIHGLDVIYHAVSLGATETLACIPHLTTMLYLPEERRATFGVQANTVRIAAGIEPSDALLGDLEKALAAV